MRLLSDLLMLVLLLLISRSYASAYRMCPSCRDASNTKGDSKGNGSTAVLAQGEPCGVYTLSCTRGLRCVPPTQEPSPLQALLQGRGVCSKTNKISGPEPTPITDPRPPRNPLDLEKAPCRKLLNAVLRGLELTLFQSSRDIYIPNCDTRGFYRRKQCRSSKGMRRGHCWCVDELGNTQPPQAGESGSLPCDED